MITTLAKAASLVLNGLGLRAIRGRVYRDSFFAAESRRILSTIDYARFRALIDQYLLPREKTKARQNEVMMVYYAHVLGLHRTPPLRILDIGSKAGMFPFIACHYGHDAWASDLPEVLARQPNASLLELLRVQTVPLKVEAFKPLPILGRRFDLITGFRTRFHSRYPWETGREHEEHWGVPEWDFFLRDLAVNQLTEQGRIYFMLNRLQEVGRRPEVPPALGTYFHRVGGRLLNFHLSFDRIDCLRPPAEPEAG
jgi:hypothetical protein